MSLESEFRQVILEMHMLATGSTQRLDGRVTGSKERPLLPAGEHEPLWQGFVERWRQAGARGRREILEEAEKALKHERRLRDPERANIHAFIHRDTLAWKRAIANSTTSIAETARKFGVSRVTVYAYREKYQDEERAA